HRLAVRAGVHTGPAVVTRTATGEALQPGHTFDIALALQSRMPGGRIAVSAESRRLIERRFASQPLPPLQLPDLNLTLTAYELGAPLQPAGRERGLEPPLINREVELQLLRDRFRLASSRAGQAVLIVGDAGIGKSRLVQALLEEVAAEAPLGLIAHGSAFAQNTPLAPLLHLLSRAIFPREETAGSSGTGSTEEERLDQLEAFLAEHDLPVAEHAPLLGALLALPVEARYPPLLLSPEARRKRTLAAALALFGALAERTAATGRTGRAGKAERRPLVLVIEDLHWIDPSTLDFLDLQLRELPSLPLLLIATFRPEFIPPWPHQTAVTQLRLSGLSEPQTEQLIERVTAGRPLPPEMHRAIVARTDGIPLFVEELTKAVLEADVSPREPAGIPFTLGGSLLARLDRLGEAKPVAQLAAVLGRTFSLELLEALSWIKGAALSNTLGRLVQAEILYRRGPAQAARYIFKHALIQDAAYLSLLASDRRELHRRLAGLLQQEFPAVAAAEPEWMAHHCERGGLLVEAVDYLLEAGLRASQRSAQVEAMRHLHRALDMLRELPAEPELLGRELSVRAVLIAVLEAVKGWGAPEVAFNAERCAALCRDLGEHHGRLQALSSLWAHHLLRSDREPALALADEIASLAETPAEVYMGWATRAFAAYYDGRFAESLAFAEPAIQLFAPELLPELAVYGDDSILMPYLVKSWALWTLGEPEKSALQQEIGQEIARRLGSPFALGMAMVSQMTLWCDLRPEDPQPIEELAGQLKTLAGEQEFAFLYAAAHCGLGWAACRRGDLAGGTVTIETGLKLYEATGARLMRAYWSSYLIEAYLAAGRFAEGLAVTRAILEQPANQLDVSFTAGIL
ncbi:MAG TPA: AAA family ATPase, partial [Thermoanaerobaculia bacterium]|nr:AAA family ATPase [Thermoanaerobaculia bacterium]